METTDSLTTLAATKKAVDTFLRAYSQRRIEEAAEIGEGYARLRQAIDRLIIVGGKRLCPYMVLLAYEAYNSQGNSHSVIPAAAAQELLHLSMLVHDDIIDRDHTRYGIRNVAGSYQDFYQQFTNDHHELDHFSASAALLAGDALLADAHSLMRQTERPQPLVRRAEAIMSRSIFDVIGGELLDTETSLLPKGSIDPLVIAEYKTSTYSFVGPLTTGAVLADAPESDIELLRQFGRHLGIAYQLKDDLLGIFGDEAKTGKSTTTDLREGKQTYLIQAFNTIASQAEKNEFYQYFQNIDATDKQLERAKAMLRTTGAEERVKQKINEHHTTCTSIIRELSMSESGRQALTALLTLCIERES